MDSQRLVHLMRESPLTATEAAKRCGVTTNAVVRWMKRGKPIEGVRVRLEGWRVGRVWMTTAEALARFIGASTWLNRLEPATSPDGISEEEADRDMAALDAKIRELQGVG